MKNAVIFYAILAVVLLGVGISFSGITVIDTGFRGIKTRFGEVVGEPLSEGIYFYNPITTDIKPIDTKVQRLSLKMSAYTKDVQQADLAITVNNSVDDNSAHLLYKEIGMDYKTKVVAPQILKAVKDTIGKWEADLLVSNREKASDEILKSLKESLEPAHILVQGY